MWYCLECGEQHEDRFQSCPKNAERAAWDKTSMARESGQFALAVLFALLAVILTYLAACLYLPLFLAPLGSRLGFGFGYVVSTGLTMMTGAISVFISSLWSLRHGSSSASVV